MLFSLIIVFSCVFYINASNVNEKRKNIIRNEFLTDISPIVTDSKSILDTELVDNKIATQPTVSETKPSEYTGKTGIPQKTGVSQDYNHQPVEVEQIEEKIPEKIEYNSPEKTESQIQNQQQTINVDFNNSLPLTNIPSFQKTNIIGYITCESVGLYKVPIVYGWDQWIVDSYEIAMSEYSGKGFGQNIASFICGHNHKALRNLNLVNVGDKIIIETPYGANFLYEVTYSNKSHIVDINFTDISSGKTLLDYNENTNDIGIFTCINGSSLDYRWFVKAKQISGTTFY